MQARYMHGKETGHPLAMEWGEESFFNHTDYIGSVRFLTFNLRFLVQYADTETGPFDWRASETVELEEPEYWALFIQSVGTSDVH